MMRRNVRFLTKILCYVLKKLEVGKKIDVPAEQWPSCKSNIMVSTKKVDITGVVESVAKPTENFEVESKNLGKIFKKRLKQRAKRSGLKCP